MSMEPDTSGLAGSADDTRHTEPTPIENTAQLQQVLKEDGTSQSAFGTMLEPVLRKTLDDRLGKVRWFRTDWQRGGALTGYATYQDDQGNEHETVVKLPVPPRERRWMAHLQNHSDVCPKLHAHGETLNGYDLAWVVMEKLEHGPLSQAWDGQEFDLLAEAAGRLYEATHDVPIDRPAPDRNWEAIHDKARQAARDGGMAEGQRWNKALKKAHRKLPDWLATWNERPIDTWCHGDLHLGNAMTRDPAPNGPALLFDFAQVHPGHWVEDAVYFEHLYWARKKRLGGRKLVKLIAKQRKQRGLPVDEHWPDLAQIKRALLAMATPAMLQHDGNPAHVAEALAVLERAVG